jgi:hypothetical protein
VSIGIILCWRGVRLNVDPFILFVTLLRVRSVGIMLYQMVEVVLEHFVTSRWRRGDRHGDFVRGEGWNFIDILAFGAGSYIASSD